MIILLLILFIDLFAHFYFERNFQNIHHLNNIYMGYYSFIILVVSFHPIQEIRYFHLYTNGSNIFSKPLSYYLTCLKASIVLTRADHFYTQLYKITSKYYFVTHYMCQHYVHTVTRLGPHYPADLSC